MFALGQFELSICLPAAAIRAILSSADGKKPEERFFFSTQFFCFRLHPIFCLRLHPKCARKAGARFPPPRDDSGTNTRVFSHAAFTAAAVRV